MREAIRRHQTPAGRCRRRTGIHTRGTAATQSDAIRRNQTQSDVPASIRREELQRGVRVGGGEPGGLLQPPSDRIELRSSLGGCGGSRVARTPQGALCRAPLHRLWREGEARDLRLVRGLGVAKGLREGGIGAAEGQGLGGRTPRQSRGNAHLHIVVIVDGLRRRSLVGDRRHPLDGWRRHRLLLLLIQRRLPFDCLWARPHIELRLMRRLAVPEALWRESESTASREPFGGWREAFVCCAPCARTPRGRGRSTPARVPPRACRAPAASAWQAPERQPQ